MRICSKKSRCPPSRAMSDGRLAGPSCSSLRPLTRSCSCVLSCFLLVVALSLFSLLQAELKKKIETAEKLEGEKGKVSEVKKGEAPPPGKELPYSPVNSKQ